MKMTEQKVHEQELGAETKWFNLKWREAQSLLEKSTLIKVENVTWKRISIIELNCYLISEYLINT